MYVYLVFHGEADCLIRSVGRVTAELSTGAGLEPESIRACRRVQAGQFQTGRQPTRYQSRINRLTRPGAANIQNAVWGQYRVAQGGAPLLISNYASDDTGASV